MNYKDIIKQAVVEPGRAINDLGFKTLEAIHENTEKTMNAALETVPWVTEENRNAVHEWFEAVRTGRDNVKGLIENNIKTFEGFIATL